MPTSRRDVLQTLGATAVAYAALPLSVDALASGERRQTHLKHASPFDLSWPAKLHGAHRAEAIALAMQQSFWDAYHTGPTLKVMHPITEQPTTLNPVLMKSARNEIAGDSRRGTVGLIR